MVFREKFSLFLKGLFMGSADVIPGVSGGTIALITGIYERLIFGIKRIKFKFIPYLLKGNFQETKKRLREEIDFGFFIPLLLGIGLAFLTLARVIKIFLNDFTAITYSFFFGLILASSVVIHERVGKKDWKNFFFLFLGFLFAFIFVGLKSLEAQHSLPIIFFSGMVAICAMILPGISGSFILLFLNQYEYMLEALNNFLFTEIFIFISGALIGILTFSRILGFLLKNYEAHTLSFLVGLMLGSLRLPYQKMSGEISLILLFPAFLGMAIIFILEGKAKALN